MRDRLIDEINTFMGHPIHEIVELVKALDEGRVIVPPVKVGDTVYKVVADKRVKKPYECKVVGFWFSELEGYNNAHLVRYVNGVIDFSFSVPIGDFGKTVFLSREEAEQALRKEDEGK